MWKRTWLLQVELCMQAWRRMGCVILVLGCCSCCCGGPWGRCTLGSRSNRPHPRDTTTWCRVAVSLPGRQRVSDRCACLALRPLNAAVCSPAPTPQPPPRQRRRRYSLLSGWPSPSSLGAGLLAAVAATAATSVRGIYHSVTFDKAKWCWYGK